MEERHRIAVFIDFDNIEIGVKNTLRRDFDVSPVLEALKERGEILTKIAYGDWTRHGQMSRSLSQHGVQMVQRHPGPRGDKNGADINLSLDALEMALTKPHIDAFAIVSGDSDFISLVEKLKQYNKTIYVVGGKAFTSTILQRNCREFISYESLLAAPAAAPSFQKPNRPTQVPRTAQSLRPPVALPLHHAAPLVFRALDVIARREVTPQLGLLKSSMMQLDSTFTERDYGATSFRQFVELLQKEKLIEVKRVDGQLLVERPPAATTPPADPLLNAEDAMSILFRALKVIDENDLWGRLSFGEVKEYVRRLEPDFDEKRYGFSQFAELLNFAQDAGLVRLEPDAESVLQMRPGIQFSASRGRFDRPHVLKISQSVPLEKASADEAKPLKEEIKDIPPPVESAMAAPLESSEATPAAPAKVSVRPRRSSGVGRVRNSGKSPRRPPSRPRT